MRAALAAVLLAASIAHAQPPAAAPFAGASSAPSPKADALESLLSERESDQAFNAAVAEARKQGINEQVILEATFLYHVDRSEDDAIAALLPQFLAKKDTFKVADSEIFSVQEDWLAVVEYVQAIACMKKGDKAGFKQHITEAFWLSPRQGAAFATHIERMRLEDAMSTVKIDPATRLVPLQGSGNAIVLGALVKDRKALVIHFWSPSNQECTDSMPDLITTAKKLESSGIAVLSVIPDSEGKMVTDARAALLPLGTNPPGAWAVDLKEDSLYQKLRIQSMPTMILLSPEGKVLFNGHPSDDEFWSALNKIDTNIVRPDILQTPDKK